jgi:hypothetical protein
MKGTFVGLILVSGATAEAPPPGVPTLVVHGEHDTMARIAEARRYAERTGAEVRTLRAGHFAMLVRGEEHDRAVHEFVARVLRAPRSASMRSADHGRRHAVTRHFASNTTSSNRTSRP